jgi:hypothetical protein
LIYVLAPKLPIGVGNALISLPNSLPEAYEKVIDQMELGQKELAFAIMSWIFRTPRPLKMYELCDALAIDVEKGELRRDLILETEQIIEACESLVEYDFVSHDVRFSHYSVYEFLRDHPSRINDLLRPVDLAKTCLAYLGFNHFDKPCVSWESTVERAEKHTFSCYAAQYWGIHIDGEAENSPEISETIFRIFTSKTKMDSILEMEIYANSRLQKVRLTKHQTFLHVIAKFGLGTICSILLDPSGDPEERYVLC